MKKYKSYVFGFVLSIVLTLSSYFLVESHVNSSHESVPHEILIPAILTLATLQLIIQLIFFLHLLSGKGSEKRWKIIIFLSTISIILVIMIGSIWIMDNLNYHMTPQQMREYIMEQDRL